MKRQTLFLIVLTLLVSICGIASAITEDEFLWTNMNTDPVKSGAPNVVDLFMDEEEPIQLERITTYHWNNGEGAEPGTVSIYLGDALLSSWPAVGRSAYGTENVYWDAAVNIILMPGYTYTVRLTDEDSWSYNAASENCGMIEFYGHRLYDFNTNKGQTDGMQDQCAVPDPGIEVILNNESIVMQDQKGMPTGPIVLNGTIYIPAPAVTQITGIDISFDSTTNQVIVMPPQKIDIVINNQTINNTTVNENSAGPVIINDHVFLPVETVTEITGHKVDWDKKNHVLNITDPSETPADGEEQISGYVWVLDRKEVDLYDRDPYPEVNINLYDGEKDGKEWFLFQWRWQYGEQYAHADIYSGCDVPPAAIKAGGDLSMEMTARIENFSYRKTSDGYDVVPIGSMAVHAGYGYTNYLKDENGEESFTLAEPGTNYALGNKEKYFTVHGTVPYSEKIGDEMTIIWREGSNTITWYYKLQHIDNEADLDNNVPAITENTDTVQAETPAHGYWKLAETIPYKMEDREYTYKTFEHFGYDVINGGVRYTYDVTNDSEYREDGGYHFTAYGEVSDPPETGFPGEKLIMDLHCWVDPDSLEGNPDFSTYSSLSMGYCHNYIASWDYAPYACGNPWTNVNYDGTNENKTSFSSGDGFPTYNRLDESGQVYMIFPEGISDGDILEIESLLHIGSSNALTTTWKYVYVE